MCAYNTSKTWSSATIVPSDHGSAVKHFLGFEEYFDRDSGWKRDIFARSL
jgi:hypothetical protein